MKTIPHIRTILRFAMVLAVAFQVTSCTTNQPRRNEVSPFSPQWRAFHHSGHRAA